MLVFLFFLLRGMPSLTLGVACCRSGGRGQRGLLVWRWGGGEDGEEGEEGGGGEEQEGGSG